MGHSVVRSHVGRTLLEDSVFHFRGLGGGSLSWGEKIYSKTMELLICNGRYYSNTVSTSTLDTEFLNALIHVHVLGPNAGELAGERNPSISKL